MKRRKRTQGGWLMLDIALAITVLLVAILPLAYSFSQERKLGRAYYWKAVAMEIVDGEFEALSAGEWKSYPAGEQDYPVSAAAAKNLPPGRFTLTVSTNRLRLEWIPLRNGSGGRVTREMSL